MHTHAKRKLSSLSSVEASALLSALNDCYQRFEHLDLEALDGLHETIAGLQLRLRHISLSKASENSLDLCGIQAAWPPVLRSTLGQSEATSPLIRDSRIAGGDKPVSSDGLDNLLARIDKTFFTKTANGAKLLTDIVLLRVATMLESGSQPVASIEPPQPSPSPLKPLTLAGEGFAGPHTPRSSISSMPRSRSPSPASTKASPTRHSRGASHRSSADPALWVTVPQAQSPSLDASPQLIVLPDFVIPLTGLPGTHDDPDLDITVSGVCDYLVALVPPDIGPGLRDRPQLLQNAVPDVTCFAIFQTKSGSGTELDVILPKAVLAVAAFVKRQKKSSMRGAVTSGKEWMFFVYNSAKDGRGGSYRTSPILSLDSMEERDIVVGLLKVWIEKGYQDVDETELFW
ncbi:hypothetical protein PENSPDRAFT_755731 [Peniophora sp. CONT]|nr:hypothetical protein PENSPDRAFT_755731 [Peniophora sp. CONT]